MIKLVITITLDKGVTPDGAVDILEEIQNLINEEIVDDDIEHITYVVQDNN